MKIFLIFKIDELKLIKLIELTGWKILVKNLILIFFSSDIGR